MYRNLFIIIPMIKLHHKISHVLEETRVILPGTQAILGFQLVAIFSNGFEKIPRWLIGVHLTSLVFIVLATVFLMTSAAYHRIVEEGEDTTRLHKFASRMIVLSMAMLASGICLDVFVIFQAVFKSWAISLSAALAHLLVFSLCWFAYPYYRKGRSG